MRIKFDFNHWMLIALISSLLIMMLFGCSASYHLDKYQDKGGVCGKIDTVRVQRFDTITNTFYYYDSLVINNDRIVPLTRQEIRYQYRLERDTLRLQETIIKEITKQAKEETKQVKSENINPWIWVVFAVLLLIAIYLIKTERYANN